MNYVGIPVEVERYCIWGIKRLMGRSRSVLINCSRISDGEQMLGALR